MPRRSKLRLTKRSVDALATEPKDTVFWDRDLAGFGVRVYRTGRKAYLAQARGPAGLTRFGLGVHGAVTLRRACAVDIVDNRFEGRAVCADIADESARDACLAEMESEAEEDGEECGDVFDARLDLCADLSDAAHEPAFGAAYAAGFVDPAAIGTSVQPHAYWPLVAGNEWVYEGTSIDDDGEEVTETINVTVTDRTSARRSRGETPKMW